MLLKRDLSKELSRYSKFPVVGVFGPRQSGKTTLVKSFYKDHVYLNFEDPEIRNFAQSDPKGFLSQHENEHGIILDEFQHVPNILSYIQLESDEKKRPGYFVLTGSQNFLMNQAITQSLAGRIGILTLLPLSINELNSNDIMPQNYNELIFKGSYPRVYTESFSPDELYPSYIHSYAERDIRLLINVENLRTFQTFMKLCAGRVGQLLNVADLAMNCGIDQRTAHRWISVLEASYIIFLLNPYHENFTKRVIKTPKIYFYDTGLACSLLGIKSSKDLSLSVFRGHLFECLIVSDLFKQFYNLGIQPALYFWRDKNGYIEVDALVNLGSKLASIEIKSGVTVVSDFFDGLKKWNQVSGTDPEDNYLIYGGLSSQKRSLANLIGWGSMGDLIKKLFEK